MGGYLIKPHVLCENLTYSLDLLLHQIYPLLWSNLAKFRLHRFLSDQSDRIIADQRCKREITIRIITTSTLSIQTLPLILILISQSTYAFASEVMALITLKIALLTDKTQIIMPLLQLPRHNRLLLLLRRLL
ncbi:unnamed protein product [Brassica oleracea]